MSADLSVLDVECSQCGAQPGHDCLGPGEGFHFSRFDRRDAVVEGDALPTYHGEGESQ